AQSARSAAMPQQSEATILSQLTEVPAGWPLATVIGAFADLAFYDPSCADATRALEASSHRLVDLWASQPAEAEAWLQRCRERFATELAGEATSWLKRWLAGGKETRQEQLCEALLRHGAAEYGKYESDYWHFSEAGLLRGEPQSSAAERERRAALYLQQPHTRARCRELAERLAAAESPETARKRQKLEEETAERRRLEAELHKSQEEGRDLRNRLAAAEGEVASKDAELQSAQSEAAKCKKRCEELTTRAAAAESAVVELRQELGQLQGECSNCREHCEELPAQLQLQAAEAEVSEHVKTKELLSQAESHAAEKQLEVQRLQPDASRSFQDGSQRAEVHLATGSCKAVLQDRCEQLQQQLAEARGQLEVLWEERGMYKERLRQLAERKTTFNPRGPAHDAACGDEQPDLAEQLGYSLVDEDHASLLSLLSGSSGCSVKQNCFMLDAIFKSRMDFFREGSDLQKGSQVLAGDGKTVLEVVDISKEAQTTKVVDLQAGSATLRVTPDHPVQVPNEGGNAGRPLCMPAGKLKVGELVMLDSGEPVALTSAETLAMECNVLKIVFKPDLPVAVFSSPSCILSQGHQKLQTRRGVRGRGKEAAYPTDEGASIPDTAAGEYMDCNATLDALTLEEQGLEKINQTRHAAMLQQSETKFLWQLTEVPAGWPLATVIDAFVHLADYHPNYYADESRALEAVSYRLVDLWAAQPAEARAWLSRRRERFATELTGKETGPEELHEALHRHGAAECSKYHGDWRFSEAGLLRGEPCGSAAQRERVAARYLQDPHTRALCRELAERLVAAESQETARKRQKLEEETAERRRLEAELQKSQEEVRELSNRLAAAEAEVCSKTAELQTAQSEAAKCREQCMEFATRAAAAESAAAEMQQELWQSQGECSNCRERCEELLTRLERQRHSRHSGRGVHGLILSARLDESPRIRGVPQRFQAKQGSKANRRSSCAHLADLTEVPVGWPLATVIDAFANLAFYGPGHPPSERARAAVSTRLAELWAAQPAEAEAWLERCRERFATELAGERTRPEELQEALLRHGAAECGKYVGHWCFSEAGLLREPWGSAAQRERWAAHYLQHPHIRPRCRELAERLAAAESPETARKRQKLEEETCERRRLEAELHKAQEEGRELSNRLAAAEAEVSSKDAELQTAQSESAKCEEFATRGGVAESVAAEMRQELRQLQEEHGKCRERCGELLTRLEAAEAEASEHAKTKELLAQAESHAAEKQLEVQRLQQDASRSFQDGSERAEVHLATGSCKVVLQDRCEQLQQQLAEARGQLEVLWEERGMYKERLRQLAERKKQESHHPTFNPRGPAPRDAAFGDEGPDLAEQLGYSLVDEDRASVLSGSSGCSVKQNCFMLDAIFKSRMDFFREGSDLQKGSQVLAGDGKTVLEVVDISKEAQTTKVVDLQAGSAALRVTPDHPVQVPNQGGNAGRPLCMPAGKLKVGELVMLDSGEPVALTSAETLPMECSVLKIVFKPDLPVAVFSSPSCILSKGHQKLQTRRGVRGRGKEAAHPTDEGASIPDTAAGEYMD
ncbi:ANK3, partial [Symbiodinium necroappetens]